MPVGHNLEWQSDRPVGSGQAELCRPTAFLRRPFSLAGRGEDEMGTWLDVIQRVVGVGTRWLAELKPGDNVDLIGPLGNWFDLSGGKSLGLLVGGGVGLPPMFYLAEALKAARWDATAFVGARSADLLAITLDERTPPTPDGTATICAAQYGRCGYATVVTTDDGSVGLRGRITDGLERHLHRLSTRSRRRAIVFACGPEPMMRTAAALADQHGIECQVCLEQAMACGMGTCQSCVVRIEDDDHHHGRSKDGRPWRYKLACTDGPVFNSHTVVW